MRQRYWIVLWTALAVAPAGCGDSADPKEEPQPDNESAPTASDTPKDGPAEGIAQFLKALRAGDHVKTKAMLTAAARETVTDLDIPFEPPASDTAEFEIGDVQYLDDDSAHVACMLSDLDENSQRRSEEVVWMLRREPQGWRIAGFAALAHEGGPLRALDFEDRQQMAATKAAMQGSPEVRQGPIEEAHRPRQPDAPIRR